MRTALTLPAAAVVAGLAGSGIAAAASPPATVPPLPSITVNGSATATVIAGAGSDQLSAAYQTALGDALAAAQAKATFVAGREGVALGALQNVTENTDVPTTACGVSAGATLPPAAAGPVKSPGKKNRKKGKSGHKGTAKKAQIVVPVDGCTVPAQVTVTYLIAGPSTATTTATTTTSAATTSTTAAITTTTATP